MSEEEPDWYERLCQEADNEVFRNRLAEWNECEALYDEPINPLDTMNRENGVVVTQSDRQRETVHEALIRLRFQDRDMRLYTVAPSINLNEVLDRAKEIITSTDASPHDKAAAADVVRLIQGYDMADDDD
jgi:hypothetical protein